MNQLVVVLVALGCALVGLLAHGRIAAIVASRASHGFEHRWQRLWVSLPVLALGSMGAAGLWLIQAPAMVRAGLIVAGVFCWYLLCIDAAIHKLPDPLVGAAGAAAAMGILGAFIADTLALETVFLAFLGGVAGLGLFFGLALIGRRSLGFGDVKLAGVLGVMTGFFGLMPFLQWLVLSFMLGGAFAAVMLITRRMRPTESIAFGPWMIVAAYLVVALNGTPEL